MTSALRHFRCTRFIVRVIYLSISTNFLKTAFRFFHRRILLSHFQVQSWRLICHGTQWIGDYGNCTRRHSVLSNDGKPQRRQQQQQHAYSTEHVVQRDGIYHLFIFAAAAIAIFLCSRHLLAAIGVSCFENSLPPTAFKLFLYSN